MDLSLFQAPALVQKQAGQVAELVSLLGEADGWLVPYGTSLREGAPSVVAFKKACEILGGLASANNTNMRWVSFFADEAFNRVQFFFRVQEREGQAFLPNLSGDGQLTLQEERAAIAFLRKLAQVMRAQSNNPRTVTLGDAEMIRVRQNIVRAMGWIESVISLLPTS